jgi:hypothetical protein
MPEGARILMGDTRQWESPTILCGCLRRYAGIHKPRYLGILGRMSLFPFRSALVLSYQKTLPEFLRVLSVRYNTRTLATGKRAGRKKEKERATFSLCTNASGSHKMELFVIGKAARPRSFPKNLQPKRDLDVRYAHNKTAWMTGAEFSRWIIGVNTEMKRCVALTVCIQSLHAMLHANAFSLLATVRQLL